MRRSFMKKDRVQGGFTLIELLIVIAIIAILALIAIPNLLEAQTRAKVSRVKADMRSIATAIESYFVDNNAYPILNRDDGLTAPDGGQHRCRYSAFLWIDKRINPDNNAYVNARAWWLTTPIAYMGTRPPLDPFATQSVGISADYFDQSYYFYNFLSATQAAARGEYLRLQDPNAPIFPDDPPFVAPVVMRFDGVGQAHHTNWAMASGGPDRTMSEPRLGEPDKGVNAYLFIEHRSHYTHMVNGNSCTYDPTNGVMSNGNIWRLQGD